MQAKSLIVPMPRILYEQTGSFNSSNSVWHISPDISNDAPCSFKLKQLGFQGEVCADLPQNTIMTKGYTQTLPKDPMKNEGYILHIGTSGICLKGADPQRLF